MDQNLVEVEILTQTITSQYGTLSAGDKLRTSPEFAKHLVEDARAAKYTSAPRKTAAGDAQAQEQHAGEQAGEQTGQQAESAEEQSGNARGKRK